MSPDFVRLDASEIVRLVKSKKASCAEVLEAHLRWVARANPGLNALLSVSEEEARARARELDGMIASGKDPGRVAGVPVVMKDNILVKGWPAACASRILAGHKAVYDATVTARLRAEGAVFLGRANMDEFAMGSSTENSAFGPTRNPWDTGRIPGGSSGGSAAAVAARMAPLALGSDTGGSIRQPAALCGILGMKPTYGRVSRFGLIAFASSLDQIGPFARSAEDAALLLGVLSGRDPRDSTSFNAPVPDYPGFLKGDLKGLKVGVPREAMGEGLDPDVGKALETAGGEMKRLGADLKEISLPHSKYALSVYYILAPSEASSNLARFDGVRYGRRTPEAGSLIEMYERSRDEGFGPEVKRRIMLGTYALSAGYYDAYYGKAQKVRTLVKGDFDAAFSQVDVILTPTSPTPAFKIGEKTDDPLQMYLSDVFTIPCNLAGLPGLSLPGGFSPAGLPIGLQLQGRPFEEGVLLKAAARYLEATGWHRKEPALCKQVT